MDGDLAHQPRSKSPRSRLDEAIERATGTLTEQKAQEAAREQQQAEREQGRSVKQEEKERSRSIEHDRGGYGYSR